MSNGDYRVDMACRYHDAGQAAAAIEVITELLAEKPNEAFYHGLLASCLLMEKRLVAAEYETEIALGQDPTLAYLHLVRARVLIFKRKLDEALEACDESLRLDPDSVDSLLLIVVIYVMQERLEEAKSCLDRAAALDPENLDVAIAYGDYYNGKGQHETALGYATQALKLNAASDAANILMGETQLALGNTEEADYHAKFAITQNPESEVALHLFANIRMRKSWYIGVWWRFNSWLATLGNLRSALVLIGGYLTFNILSVVAEDLGYPRTSSVLAIAWLALVLYSWIGIPMYHRAMAKELQKFTFNPKF